MEVADQAGGPAKLGITVEQVELVGPGGRAAEAGLVEMGEQGVDGVQGPAGRRTVSPTRTTPLLMFPPLSGVSLSAIDRSPMRPGSGIRQLTDVLRCKLHHYLQ